MKCIRVWTLVLLALLGIGGIAGSVAMIVSSLRHVAGFMPLSLLQYSPFDSYLIPGIILLLANGLLPLWVYARVTARRPLYGLCTVLQGCVLMGWLIVECLMLRMLMWLQMVYFGLAFLLIVFGWLLSRRPEQPATVQG